MKCSIILRAPSLSLRPKSDVSDFGQLIKRPNSGKPEFGCKRGEGTMRHLPSKFDQRWFDISGKRTSVSARKLPGIRDIALEGCAVSLSP